MREWRLDAQSGSLSINFERFRIPPYGLEGGGPGSLSRTTVRRADGTVEALWSKVSGVPLRRGDVVTIETSGGGGHGDPARRWPDSLDADFAEGLVTPEGAARDYGRVPRQGES